MTADPAQAAKAVREDLGKIGILTLSITAGVARGGLAEARVHCLASR